MNLRDLPRYEVFRCAVEQLREGVNSLPEFSSRLKDDAELKRLRTDARVELQSIYDEVRKELDLPAVPVFLPVRKKVRVRGQAHAMGGDPTEIRVYPIEGPTGIPYTNWTPSQLTVCSKSVVFEIFKHEISHVIATHRYGRLDNHDNNFVAAYDEINEYFKRHGFQLLIDPSLELWGVPLTSYAAQVARTRGAKWMSAPVAANAGCLRYFAAAAAIVVVFMILLTLT